MDRRGISRHLILVRDANNFPVVYVTGPIWPLRGRPVVGLMETEAAIQGATAVLTYRKLNKPALGPLGDNLDDMGAA